MLFRNSLLLLGALFATTVLAVPVQDISETSIDLETSTDTANADHLTVTVTRVDDLLSDNGEWLAERIMAVVMNFDVNDDQIFLNGVPLPLGASSVQIEAAIVANAELLTISNTDDAIALAASFDTGLVTVEVEATAEILANEDGQAPLRRITVIERIIEIDGQSVVQTVAGQQIIDVYNDGTVTKYTGCGGAAQIQNEYADASEEPEQLPCGQKFRQWYNNQPISVRASMAAFTGAIAATFFAILYRAMSSRRRGYVAVAVDEYAHLDSTLDNKYPVDVKVASPPTYEEDAKDEDKKPLVL
jgi:hypothetical protein